MKKKRKAGSLFAAVTAFTVVASVAVPNVTHAAHFTDIQGNTHEQAIKALIDEGLINGYPDGTFKPNKELTRSDVVKLIGKYLVANGRNIPTDYKTKMRFSDLTSNTSKELLQYAALVKDAGIFNGSNGKLNTTEKMTRENMAVVLVNALSAVNGFNYMTYVENQQFNKEIFDLADAKESAQSAINVLDYYDITQVHNFNPKEIITRGQFASFLYKVTKLTAPALSVQSVDVLSKDKLFVTLSNQTKHTVQLAEPLKENVKTTVKFDINDTLFTATVTYKVNEFKVEEVEGLNGSQFVVHFNEKVDLFTTKNPDEIKKHFTLTGIDQHGDVDFKNGALSADGRSYTITIDSLQPLEKRYRLEINKVYSEQGKALPEYDQIVYFERDTTAPSIKGIEIINEDKVKVLFSEPVDTLFGLMQFRVASGLAVSGITGKIDNLATEVEIDLSNASMNGVRVKDGTEIIATFGYVKDLAGNSSSPKPLIATLTVGGEDGVEPKLKSVTQLGAQKVKLTFSEEMSPISKADLSIKKGENDLKINHIEQDIDDESSFVVTLDSYLQGSVTIATAENRTVRDKSGEKTTFKTTQSFKYDASVPTVVKTSVSRDGNNEYLYITFDKNVVVSDKAKVQMNGEYYFYDTGFEIPSSKTARIHPVKDEPTVIRILLNELLKDIDRENATYYTDLTFDGVTNEYDVKVSNIKGVQFTRTKDYQLNGERLEVLSIETSWTSDDIDSSRQIIIHFNYPLDPETAKKWSNYSVSGTSLDEVNFNPSNPTQVELVLQNNAFRNEQASAIKIKNLKAEGSYEVMEEYEGIVHLHEARRPIFKNAQVTDAREITLTFTEDLSDIESDYFIVRATKDKKKLNVKAYNHSTDKEKIIIKILDNLDKAQELEIELKGNKYITDLYGNETVFKRTTVHVPTNFWK